MAAVPPRAPRRRPRPGSLQRPINGRLYRGTWLLVALPLLVAAFSVARPGPLPPPNLPPAFDRLSALDLTKDLAIHYPNRVPGTAGATGAARWFREQLRPYGFEVQAERFRARIPGVGETLLTNLLAIAPGRSQRAIVVMAHRDATGSGQGANDDASGTAALIELARAYANPSGGGSAGSPRVRPTFTIIFLSTDGGAYGSLGAAHFAEHSPYREGVVAVVDLDAIASTGPPRLIFTGDTSRSPAASLVETAAAQVQQETGAQPARASMLRQLIDLGFPFSLYGQAPFVARGIPAVTITSAGDRPLNTFTDTTPRLSLQRLGQLGRAAQNTLDALDQGLDLAQGTSSYVYLGSRIIRGWAVELVLIAALLPYCAAVVDLFARCRRRRVPVAPALRSYRSRLCFWLWSGAVFFLFAIVGVWPRGAPRPPALEGAAVHWPAAGIVGLAALMLLSWFVSRDRLLPRRRVRVQEELAGHVGALLALGLVALLIVATNPFALVFVLPALHIWLWLPQVRTQAPWVRALLLACGFVGPLLLIWSFASRYELGLDAPWYVAELFVLGYAPLPAFVIGLCFLAGAAQLVALVAGRYAPYPEASGRGRRGPLRTVFRRLYLAERHRRAASADGSRALEG
jgi:peptidase M28-like protein